MGVNVAARLEELAAPGEVLISDTAHQSLDGKAAVKFGGGDVHQLKNVARPIQVWCWPVKTGAAPDAAAAADDVPLTLPDKPSVAVLPFDNMSGDPEQDFFVDGMVEDIITGLSKFHSLFVVARNTSFAYKGQIIDVKEVGRDLGVRFVVEGSVRKAGGRVRITAQLIEAETGNHVWAERYDRELADIFDLQDEMTETIVSALDQEIGNLERVRATRKHPDSLEVWEIIQRGLHHLWQMTPDGLSEATAHFSRSIEFDSKFGQAHSLLSFALMHQIFLGVADDNERTLTTAERHAKEALKFDDRDSLAHEMLARILCLRGSYDEAILEAKRAVDANPNSASALFALGLMCHWGNRPAEGLDAAEHAMRLSPKDPRFFHFLTLTGSILCEIGRTDEGLEMLRQAASLPHGDYRMAMLLAVHCAGAGLLAEAENAMKKVFEFIPDFTLGMFESKLSANYHPEVKQRMLIDLGRIKTVT